MSEIDFIDTTLRDGHQSLWATRMTTAMMLPIAPVIDRAGYKLIDLMGTVQFDACLRYLREDPWERIRLIKKAMPRTPLGAGFRSEGLTGFNIVPDSLVCLWIERLAANGISELLIMESLHDWENIAAYVDAGRAAGMTIKIPLVYSESPVHTDEYYASKTSTLMARLKPDAVYIKDPTGVITPDRVKTLVPAIMQHLGPLPLELHSHCTTGLAPLAYLEAIKLGVKTLHTAVPPLANGASQPSITNVVHNARILGFEPRIDDEAVAEEAAYFRKVARQEGRPEGAPVEYDLLQYQHQIPGGMISNLKFMLSQRNLEHRLGEVMAEIARIRVDWGYPIMVTPFSQILGTQAVLNVVTGKRYSVAPRETIMYIRELYGRAPAPIDQNVKDQILGLPEAKDLLDWTPPQPSIAEIRRKAGRPDTPDDEFLLRTLFAEEHVDATLASGPMKTTYSVAGSPVITLLEALLKQKSKSFVHVSRNDLSLTIHNKTGVY